MDSVASPPLNREVASFCRPISASASSLPRPKGKTWTILEGNKRGAALYIRCILAKIETLPTSLQVLVGLTANPFPWLRVR